MTLETLLWWALACGLAAVVGWLILDSDAEID